MEEFGEETDFTSLRGCQASRYAHGVQFVQKTLWRVFRGTTLGFQNGVIEPFVFHEKIASRHEPQAVVTAGDFLAAEIAVLTPHLLRSPCEYEYWELVWTLDSETFLKPYVLFGVAQGILRGDWLN